MHRRFFNKLATSFLGIYFIPKTLSQTESYSSSLVIETFDDAATCKIYLTNNTTKGFIEFIISTKNKLFDIITSNDTGKLLTATFSYGNEADYFYTQDLEILSFARKRIDNEGKNIIIEMVFENKTIVLKDPQLSGIGIPFENKSEPFSLMQYFGYAPRTSNFDIYLT
jgi:hypothetical protein